MRSLPSLDASAGIRLLTLVVALTLLAVDVAQAQAVVPAPGFSGGPEVVGDGLFWAGNSAGQENVFLSTATSTRLLVPDAALSTVNVDDGWVVVSGASGPKVGRIGERLRTVRALRRCPPIPGFRENPRLQGGIRVEAVANGSLYAVVRASCLDRRPRYAQFLVRVRLGASSLHVIGRVPSGAIALAAAGPRIALTYEAGARPADKGLVGRVRVEVVDAHNGRPLYRLAPPRDQHATSDPEAQLYAIGRYRETQLDAKGDVLVIGDFRLFTSHGAFGWWGAPRTRVGRRLESGESPSLSEGRIAYATSRESETIIHVLNLATGEARTIVTFSGAARVEGFDVGRTVLAWAQQNYAYTMQHQAGIPSLPCVTEAPVGSPELGEMPLSTAAPPIFIHATPGPRPVGLLCAGPK